jgi:CBS domain-containing protein
LPVHVAAPAILDRRCGATPTEEARKAVAEGAGPRVDTAGDYMTAAPAAVHLDADVHEVASTMFELGCRHLPVVSDKGGQVIGMVSIRDLLGTAIRLAGPS